MGWDEVIIHPCSHRAGLSYLGMRETGLVCLRTVSEWQPECHLPELFLPPILLSSFSILLKILLYLLELLLYFTKVMSPHG